MRPPLPLASWAWFFDVDGTLAPIVSTPDAALVDDLMLELIADLARQSHGAVALISGRSLAQLDALFPNVRLPAAGQHGAEHRAAGGLITRREPHDAIMEFVRDSFAHIARPHHHVVVEDKGLSVALHYRLVPDRDVELTAQVGKVYGQLPSGFRMLHGKYVVEIVPDGVDKGSALLAFMREPPFKGRPTVFIGDDLTDEKGFAVVNAQNGISIKVGLGTSCAKYRLDSVAEVRDWLALLPNLGSESQIRIGGEVP